ncbi:MAG: undecaprenyldiphospho-muramoylpentapeptide beta-N-acetylglucosaminyltransferase [Bacteroidota bacterium]|nr:undecaprenyldiphospho-muramoylpentapeptide beta-N-acetylglucosaminyltransferase [Bacteroidota bacterium]MDX5431700.1 undecaprenyldiphospho-muramoylpentapeptide beta-N-acetylglucosaminyltransferase [Bacteroidota bacterium]MDX5470415.1 undecaprenyldiphospho-muramoylpentapeptide beta-N-acetylglucosaminyltransferase [Bacteroidota bacterium]
MSLHRVIISGGGTGGHIFPAVAIANEIRAQHPDCNILFVGANGRMEMTRVPEAGYRIEGLDIAGLQRKLDPKNLLLPFKVIKSYRQARSILKKFDPQIAIGVGGYASAPLLFAAQRMGIPTLIQEQNSYAGLTNKILARRAQKICVAYEGMESYFPKDKIILTGNPVRGEMVQWKGKEEEARTTFSLDKDKPVVLAIGGSLGARSINEALYASLDRFRDAGVQLLWQTGKAFAQKAADASGNGIHTLPFIQRMDLAYAAADIIISRAGALSISELSLVGKPCILVPSPNVAEDHQTKNAQVLVKAGAALSVRDTEASAILVDEALTLLRKKELCATLSEHILSLGIGDAATRIKKEIDQLV